MTNTYLKIAWRNLTKNRASSIINIGGLAVGMAIVMLISLWLWDELSFDKYHKNYDRIAQVMQNQPYNGNIRTRTTLPIPLATQLKLSYRNDFKYVVLSTLTKDHILTFADKKILEPGNFMEADAPKMLSLKMLSGTQEGLADQSSVLLSQSVSKTLFGDSDPLTKTIKIDDKLTAKVTGVYEDLPFNTTLRNVSFIAPWNGGSDNCWDCNSWQIFTQIADNADMAVASAKIKDIIFDNTRQNNAAFRPVVFLQPMSRWHLYSEFKNGVNVGGRVQFVWLFGIIGFFVLLLACINFMNLSTARSEKRAKEVGIRKAVGSQRNQLITQFFSESLLTAFIAFAFSILLVELVLPFFNEIADKKVSIPWGNLLFWLISAGFIVVTGLIAGIYPALYLSSFNPVKVLKGTFRPGRFAAIPRKVLVVLQFTVSVMLIIGTIVVFRQIQFVKDRPIGYDRNGLIVLAAPTADLHKNFSAFCDDLTKSGKLSYIAESSSPTTDVLGNTNSIRWAGEDPNLKTLFPIIGVSYEYGQTVGWQFKDGRDFSRAFLTDSAGFVINEAAVKYMGLRDPVGKFVTLQGQPYKIIGVIRDMLMESPYEEVRPSFYYLNTYKGNFINIRINPTANASSALAVIKSVCKKYAPEVPFDYKFADEEYAHKFAAEVRIGKLATVFASLAIFISCLGLFGLASFMAERRIKEIGVRKILGASVFHLWGLLSRDFAMLVILSVLIASPIGYYMMHHWLQNYAYRSDIAWWIFVVPAIGSLVITLLTVSYQSIKAALANPVISLRNE
jgi:ABC-type antimicrobial peptide transport system permease subunit